jgi:hypothetical protein
VPHLVLTILDDPSVERVMREASFSSTAVKAAMLRCLSDPAAPDSSVYANAWVMQRQASHREGEVSAWGAARETNPAWEEFEVRKKGIFPSPTNAWGPPTAY